MDENLKAQLAWLSRTSGEDVRDWERVSQGDIICFILNRMKPGIIKLSEITDGVDRFARVTNWRTSNQAMRRLGIGWSFDEVKLVMADVKELSHVVKAIKRWETRNLDEPLEPISPDEWNDEDIPSWFTQYAAKKLEEKKLAAGESSTKKTKQVEQKINLREKIRKERVPIAEQMNLDLTKTKTRSKTVSRVAYQIFDDRTYRQKCREERVPLTAEMGVSPQKLKVKPAPRFYFVY